MTAWWREAVVYQVYVRSFADSNADGIGDLAGVTAHLEHIASLGANAIWLTPFFPSPQRDHGYDVADYFDVEPDYGTLDDFDRMTTRCHELGLRVVADIVPNHCSSDHRWFRDALASSPESPERQRFWFRDGRGAHGELPPNNWVAAFGGPAWTQVPDGQWYLHSFTPWQPDLNWENDETAAMFDDVLRFWFDRGVDGFRVDAVTHLGKAPDLPDAPPPPPGTAETGAIGHNPYLVYWPSAHDAWRRWRMVLDQYERDHPGREVFMVAEAYTPGRIEVLLDYVRPDEFHQAFSFDLLLAPWNAATIRAAIDETLRTFVPAGAAMTWTMNNHDTQRAVTRLGRAGVTDPASWTGSNLIYPEGPVDDALGGDRARAALLLLAALPGSMYLYQGEELGLPEVLDIDAADRTDPIFARTEGREIGRDGCRVPLPWTADPTTAFGFSSGPATPWLPQPDDWGAKSAAVENDDPSSTLALYRSVLAARAALPAGDETLTWVDAGRDDIVVFARAGITTVLNPTGQPVVLDDVEALRRRIVVSSRPGHRDPSVIPGDTCCWLTDVAATTPSGDATADSDGRT